jgi:hypothetical protein
MCAMFSCMFSGTSGIILSQEGYVSGRIVRRELGGETNRCGAGEMTSGEGAGI